MKDGDTTNTIISLSKARRILGSLARSLNDTQVIEIIHALHLLAKHQLSYNGSNNERDLQHKPKS